jgi:hypothetical protein
VAHSKGVSHERPPAIERRPLLAAALSDWRTTKVDVRAIRFGPGQMTGLHVHPCHVVWLYSGPPPHREDDPLDTFAEGGRRISVMGLVALEEQVLFRGSRGIVLRYGQIYGLGTWNAGPTGSAPVHVDAAARAAALAVTRGERGIYNIVDDAGAVANAKARAALGWDPDLR